MESFQQYVATKAFLTLMRKPMNVDPGDCICGLEDVGELRVPTERSGAPQTGEKPGARACPVPPPRSSIFVLLEDVRGLLNPRLVQISLEFILTWGTHITKPAGQLRLLWALARCGEPRDVLGTCKLLCHCLQTLRVLSKPSAEERVRHHQMLEYYGTAEYFVLAVDAVNAIVEQLFAASKRNFAFSEDWIDVHRLLEVGPLYELLSAGSWASLQELYLNSGSALTEALENVRDALIALPYEEHYRPRPGGVGERDLADMNRRALERAGNVDELRSQLVALGAAGVAAVLGVVRKQQTEHSQLLRESQLVRSAFRAQEDLEVDRVDMFGAFTVSYKTLNRVFGIQRLQERQNADMSLRLHQDALARSGIQTPLQDLRYEREDVWVAKEVLKSANFWKIAAGAGCLALVVRRALRWLVTDVE